MKSCTTQFWQCPKITMHVDHIIKTIAVLATTISAKFFGPRYCGKLRPPGIEPGTI